MIMLCCANTIISRIFSIDSVAIFCFDEKAIQSGRRDVGNYICWKVSFPGCFYGIAIQIGCKYLQGNPSLRIHFFNHFLYHNGQ